MKKNLKKVFLPVLCLTLCCVLCCTGCRLLPQTGSVDNVRIETVDSALYTQQDIDDAIAVILKDFKSFYDCTLTRIAYAGDEITQEEIDCHREGYFESWGDFDELIVLYSDFTVDSDRHDSLMKGPYTNWNWILVRQDGGPWRHADHGYG